ncbi:radical SAM protein [Geomesophilobacter sediminis]|uniref:Radical SAM protein n=1 Tax=Geomesophilobacter sediminis TaxID=2798584 RepID=A0A8J7J132_9BACT|nr:radical SAM protein [Geomesophilobacter sediminis]MBJ6726452.1 radical SAM protein [Geomesophilobacter sediminis]
MTAPCILDIVHGSITDGPGIRTTVHFPGCPLCCVWCKHPADGSACAPRPSFEMERGGAAGAAGACAGNAPAGNLYGEPWPVDQLVAALLEDYELHQATGGGVTLAVGDPTPHAGYLATLLNNLKEKGTHLTLQTCGVFDYDVFRRELLPSLDLVYFDLKFVDPTLHRIYTGSDNAPILANFRLLAADLGDRLIPRVPMVPGITMTEQNVGGIAAFLRESGASSSMLVPYVP